MPHKLAFLRDSFDNGYANQILTEDGTSGQIRSKDEMLLTLDGMSNSGLITDFQGSFESGFSVDLDTESLLYLAYSMIHQMQANTSKYNELLEKLSVYILNRNVDGFTFHRGKIGPDGGCDFFGWKDGGSIIDIFNLDTTSTASSIIGQCKLHSAIHGDGEISFNTRDLIGTQELLTQTHYFERWAPDELKNNDNLKLPLQNPFQKSILILIYIGGRDKIAASDICSTLVTIGPSVFATLLVGSGLIKELRQANPQAEIKDFLSTSEPIMDHLLKS